MNGRDDQVGDRVLGTDGPVGGADDDGRASGVVGRRGVLVVEVLGVVVEVRTVGPPAPLAAAGGAIGGLRAAGVVA